MESVNTVSHCSGVRKYIVIVYSSVNGQDIELLVRQYRFSRCQGVFWSLVEHNPWVEGIQVQSVITYSHVIGLESAYSWYDLV